MSADLFEGRRKSVRGDVLVEVVEELLLPFCEDQPPLLFPVYDTG